MLTGVYPLTFGSMAFGGEAAAGKSPPDIVKSSISRTFISTHLVESINKQGTAVLLIEQSASMTPSVANRAYVLETDTVVIEDDAHQMANDPRVKKVYLGA